MIFDSYMLFGGSIVITAFVVYNAVNAIWAHRAEHACLRNDLHREAERVYQEIQRVREELLGEIASVRHITYSDGK